MTYKLYGITVKISAKILAEFLMCLVIEIKDFLFLLHCPLKMDKIVNHEFRLGSLLCKSYNAGTSQPTQMPTQVHKKLDMPE